MLRWGREAQPEPKRPALISTPNTITEREREREDEAAAFPHPRRPLRSGNFGLLPNPSRSASYRKQRRLQAEDIYSLNVYINTHIDFPVVSRYQDLSGLMASY